MNSAKLHLSPAIFTIDSIPNKYFIGFSDGSDWNGFGCPSFEKPIATIVLEASAGAGYQWKYDAEADAFIVWNTEDPEGYEPEIFGGYDATVDGKTIRVYPVGAYSWVWNAATLIKSPEEIEALKENWSNDPCWDIEDTEGFEAYREELVAFAAEKRAEWDADLRRQQTLRQMRLEQRAKELECSVALVEYIEKLERRLENHISRQADFEDFRSTIN